MNSSASNAASHLFKSENIMPNLTSELEFNFPELKGFNVSNAYVEFGELYMTSEYEIPTSLYSECESYATK